MVLSVAPRGTADFVVAGGLLSSGLKRNTLKALSRMGLSSATRDTQWPPSSTTFPSDFLLWHETLSCSYAWLSVPMSWQGSWLRCLLKKMFRILLPVLAVMIEVYYIQLFKVFFHLAGSCCLFPTPYDVWI